MMCLKNLKINFLFLHLIAVLVHGMSLYLSCLFIPWQPFPNIFSFLVDFCTLYESGAVIGLLTYCNNCKHIVKDILSLKIC